ncbi:MAG: class I SAM-dependent methyltransferase [Bacteroidales bacterium]|nr:MAG: class I SAM-dependent methyltransferase [Bacteroidales bacterium]
MKNKAQSFWDKQAKRYDYGEKKFETVTKEIIAKTKKYLDSNDNVLDFGCATGTKTLYLASAIKHIHGLDISEEMVKEAIKKKHESNIINCSFSQGTIFNDDLEKASFDKIISYSVIHLLEDSVKVIQRIHELLKPGGLFISTIACFKDKMALKNRLEFKAYLIMKRFGIFPLHLNLYKTADVEKLIENQDFKIVESEKIFHLITASFIVARKP